MTKIKIRKGNVMPNSFEEEVVMFLSDHLSIAPDKLTRSTRLFHDLGIDGDDAVELIESFSDRFSVDIADFEFSRYFGEEAAVTPLSIFRIFFHGTKDIRPLSVESLILAVQKNKLQ